MKLTANNNISSLDKRKYALILDEICKHFEVTMEELEKPSHEFRFVEARNFAFHFTKKYTKLSLASMAFPFNRDHAVAIHGLRTLDNLIETKYNGIGLHMEKLTKVISRIMPENLKTRREKYHYRRMFYKSRLWKREKLSLEG